MKREASRFDYEKSPWASGDAAQAPDRGEHCEAAGAIEPCAIRRGEAMTSGTNSKTPYALPHSRLTCPDIMLSRVNS